MQEPPEGISLNFAFAVLPSDTELASVPASIAQSFTEGDLFHETASRTLFPRLLDVKFDQKFAAFKRGLDEKQAATQSQL